MTYNHYGVRGRSWWGFDFIFRRESRRTKEIIEEKSQSMVCDRRDLIISSLGGFSNQEKAC